MAKRMVDKAEKLQKLADLIDIVGNKVEFGGDVSVDGELNFNTLPLVAEFELTYEDDEGDYEGDYHMSPIPEGFYLVKYSDKANASLSNTRILYGSINDNGIYFEDNKSSSVSGGVICPYISFEAGTNSYAFEGSILDNHSQVIPIIKFEVYKLF